MRSACGVTLAPYPRYHAKPDYDSVPWIAGPIARRMPARLGVRLETAPGAPPTQYDEPAKSLSTSFFIVAPS